MARSSRLWRAAGALLAAPLLLVGLLFACAYVVSPPSAGAPIAAQLHVPRPAIIAHRGLSYWAPEETRPAYVLAREIGADYLEADVQRTRDGVLIALHDDTLARTTNVAAIFPERRDQGPDAFTWDELTRLDAGSWWNAAHPDRARPAYVGLRILRLEELIDLALADAGTAPRPGLYLETKGADKYQGYERELVALLRARGLLDSTAPGAAPRLIFQSFVPESLARLRELAPAVPRVLLIEREAVGKQPWSAFVQRARSLGAGLGPSGYEGMPWHTGPAHRAGLLVHHYTINQAWQLRLLRQLGSDGVFTDTADLALAVFGRGIPTAPGALYDRDAALRAAFAKAGL